MKVYKWDHNSGYRLSVTASEEPYHDGSGTAYCHASIWIPVKECRRRQMHVAITPKRRETTIENGRATLGFIGVEIMAGVPVLHLVLEHDQSDER